ncbi:unnamed protein product [Withania somnifera]
MNMNLSAQLNQAIPTANNNNALIADDFECTIRERDRFMPIANVIRIMRKILPPHAKISDDSKETIRECVSEFISFRRKTITAEDVLWAMSKLGFDDYIEPPTLHLHRYRECDGGERGSLGGEPLILMKPGIVIDPAASTSIANMAPISYPLPTNFTMAHHHHAYFAYAHMSNDNVASNSQANDGEANNREHKE